MGIFVKQILNTRSPLMVNKAQQNGETKTNHNKHFSTTSQITRQNRNTKTSPRRITNQHWRQRYCHSTKTKGGLRKCASYQQHQEKS